MPESEAGWRIEPPGVGADRAQAQARRHRRRRAARAAARDQRLRRPGLGPRVDHRAEPARDVGRAHGELVQIGLAEQHRAGAPQVAAHGRFVGRHEVEEDARAGGGQHALGAEQVLDRERDAFQRPRLAPRDAPIRIRRHLERALGRLGDEGVERSARRHRLEVRRGQLRRRELFLAQAGARGGERELGEIAHSTTLGTTK